jgi:hypothetical protein
MAAKEILRPPDPRNFPGVTFPGFRFLLEVAREINNAMAQRDTVAYGAEVTINLSTVTGDLVDIGPLTGNITVNFAGGDDGQKITLRLTQDGTGGRVVTWGGMVRFSTDLPGAVLSTGASKTDYIGFRYSATADKYDCVATNKGF